MNFLIFFLIYDLHYCEILIICSVMIFMDFQGQPIHEYKNPPNLRSDKKVEFRNITITNIKYLTLFFFYAKSTNLSAHEIVFFSLKITKIGTHKIK